MKLLILAAFLAVACARNTQHLVGDSECTEGPAYWCKNLQTAKQCKAQKYCTERVWAKQMKSTSCDTCKQVVGVVHAYLADNLTETELIQALNGLCSFLGTYSTECKAMVNSYGKEIMSLISQYTANPAMICQMLGMCKAEGSINVQTHMKMQKIMPIVFAAKKELEQPRSSALCIVCEFAMSKIDSYITTNSSETTIISYVEKICSYLPSTIKTECDALITEYGSAIIQLLVKQLEPKTVCTEIKLCSATVKMVELSKPVVKSAGYCQVCEAVVSYVETLLNNNTEAEIVGLLGQLCAELGSYKDECNTIVKTYIPSIIELLKKELTPALVCKELGLCSQMQEALMKFFVRDVSNGTYCTYCKLAVTYVDNLLKNQQTEAEITTLLESLCSYLGTYQAECKSIMSSYLPLVFKYLAQELSPDLVCKELGLCTAMEPLVTKVLKVEQPKKANNFITCEACEYLVGYVEGLVNTKTEAEIATMVEKYCSVLGSLKSECDSLVATYLPEIIELLKKELSPSTVCKELGMCSAKKSHAIKLLKAEKTKKVQGGTYCATCEAVVGYVEGLINTKTEAEIATIVKGLCSYLGSYSAECNALVDQYLPQIIELLKQELTPKLVCTEIGLCTAMQKMLTYAKTSGANGGSFCTVCKVLVGYVDNMLKDKKTETEITATLEKLCTYFGSYSTQCQTYMTAYLPLIYKYLAQELTPDLVCKELTLCTSIANDSRAVFMKHALRV